MQLCSIGTGLILNVLGCAHIKCSNKIYFCPWFYMRTASPKITATQCLHTNQPWRDMGITFMDINLTAKSEPHFPQTTGKAEGGTQDLHLFIFHLFILHSFILHLFSENASPEMAAVEEDVSLSCKSHAAPEGSPSNLARTNVHFVWGSSPQDICFTSLVFHELWKCGAELRTVNGCRSHSTWQWNLAGLLPGLSHQFSYIWEADFQTAVLLSWSTELWNNLHWNGTWHKMKRKMNCYSN